MTELLRIEDLSFGYDSDRALFEHLSFTLAAGEIFSITGPPTSGKTTLLRILIKELKPKAGRGFYLGRPLFGKRSYSAKSLRQEIGLLMEENHLLEERSVFDNVALSLRLAGIPEHRITERVLNTLGNVGLLGKAKQRVVELAASEKRFIALARAIARNAQLVLADLGSSGSDQDLIVKQLELAAACGSGVLIFSRTQNRASKGLILERPAEVSKVG